MAVTVALEHAEAWGAAAKRRGAGAVLVGLGAGVTAGLAALSVMPGAMEIAWAAGLGVPLLALGVWLAWARPWWGVLALAAWVPVEATVVSRLPMPAAARPAAEVAGEAWLYLAVMAVWVRTRLAAWRVQEQGRAGAGWLRTPVDGALLLFVLWGCMTTFLNAAPVWPAAMNLRTMVRYAAVFYLVVQLRPDARQVRALVGVIAVSVALQIALAWGQKLVGGPLLSWAMPVAGEGERSFRLTRRGREIGAVFGTLGDTVYLGVFLAVGAALLSGWWRVRRCAVDASGLRFRMRVWVGCVLALLAASAWTYSRAALLAVMLGLAVTMLAGVSRRRLLAGGVLGLAMIVSVAVWGPGLARGYNHPGKEQMSALENVTGVFSAQYIERAKQQRLGAMLGIAPTALMNAPLTGYGLATQNTVNQLNAAEPSYLAKTLTESGFEDVYWVALVCYLGLPGLVLAGLMLSRLAWCGVRAMRVEGGAEMWIARVLGMASVCLVLQAGLLMMFVRVLEFRAFGLYLWLIPGLAWAMVCSRERGREVDEVSAGPRDNAWA